MNSVLISSTEDSAEPVMDSQSQSLATEGVGWWQLPATVGSFLFQEASNMKGGEQSVSQMKLLAAHQKKD